MVIPKEPILIPKKTPELLKAEYEHKLKIYLNEGFTANIDQFVRKMVQDKRG